MNNYQKQKAKARATAIEWQMWASVERLSCLELATWQAYFYKLGKHYGLLKEFKENGVI